MLLAFFTPGCGLRQSQTGSLSSRLIDNKGNAVVGAQVFSIFAESEKVYSAADGGFYLSELPAGLNNIVIIHPDFAVEERQVEIRSNATTRLETIRLDQANTPNRISDIRVVSVASTSAKVGWSTYREVVCNIAYGTSRGYGNLYREEHAAKVHEAVLEDLEPETLYHFRVQYIDEFAFSHYSYDYTFKTTLADRPEAPASIEVKPFTALGVVELAWQKPQKGSVKGYNVYRKENGAGWLRINDSQVPADGFRFEDLAAMGGSFYRYAVAAVNELGAESELVETSVYFIPGVLNDNQRISISQSPVILTSDLVVAAGVTLQADPGVEFRISAHDSIGAGLDEDRVELIVHGRVSLVGTEEQPIVFAPHDGSGQRAHWQGIQIKSSMTGISELKHVRMTGCAGYAIEVEAQMVRLGNLFLSYCENGVLLDGVTDSIHFDSCTFREISGTAVDLVNCRQVIVSNSEFYDLAVAVKNQTQNQSDLLQIYDTYIEAKDTGIKGIMGRTKLYNLSIVAHNGVGIEIENTLNRRENIIDHCTIDALNAIRIHEGEVLIENNILVNRHSQGEVGINNLSIFTPFYDYNNLFGFADAYISSGPGVGALEIDPQFVGGNPFSYVLKSESQLNRLDRYASQMGRYGQSRL